MVVFWVKPFRLSLKAENVRIVDWSCSSSFFVLSRNSSIPGWRTLQPARTVWNMPAMDLQYCSEEVKSSCMLCVRVWDCGTVTIWHCDTMTLWDRETVRLWDCETVELWDCESVGLWDCESVGLLLSTDRSHLCLSWRVSARPRSVYGLHSNGLVQCSARVTCYMCTIVCLPKVTFSHSVVYQTVMNNMGVRCSESCTTTSSHFLMKWRGGMWNYSSANWFAGHLVKHPCKHWDSNIWQQLQRVSKKWFMWTMSQATHGGRSILISISSNKINDKVSLCLFDYRCK